MIAWTRKLATGCEKNEMNEPKKYLVGEMNITLSYIGLWEMKVKELLGITTTLMI